jgi:hypothetical protein
MGYAARNNKTAKLAKAGQLAPLTPAKRRRVNKPVNVVGPRRVMTVLAMMAAVVVGRFGR